MLNYKQLWFRGTSAALVFLLTLFWTGQEWAQAHAAEKQTALRLEVVAANLRLNPLQVSSPEAYEAQAKLAAAERRRRALEALRQHTGADAQEALAKQAQQRAKQVEGARPSAKLARELAKAQAAGLPEEKQREAVERARPSVAAALRRGKQGLQHPEAEKPTFTPQQTERPRFQQVKPRGREAHGALTPQLEELYASVAGEAVVEEANGTLWRVEDVLLGRPRRPLMLAAAGMDMGFVLPLMGVLPAPASEDLAETPETQRTPEIVALADSLKRQPLALYNWVHTKVRPQLYYGSKKGAAATLAEGTGNDFDTSSLLIALLRASGVPARYEYGMVRLSPAQAEALTGTPDIQRAAYLLSQSGIPAGIGAGGKTLLMERVWVRAHVPYGNYRGTGPGGEALWVRLDAGLKRMRHTQGVNLRGAAHFDFNAYLGGRQSTTPVEIFEGQLLAAAQAKNLCHSLEDALVKSTVEEDVFRLLPAEHPARVEESLMLFARPPEAFRHSVTLTLDGASHSFELAQLQGRTLALRYVGATPKDTEAIAAAGGIANVVPMEVKVVPSLRLDGVEVKRFASLNPGLKQGLTVRVTLPGGSPVEMKHRFAAGGVYGLLVSAGTETMGRVGALRRAVQEATGEDKWEAEAHLALALYSHRQESAQQRLFSLQGHAAIKDVLEGMAGRGLHSRSVNGVPVELAFGDYFIDVVRDSLTPVPRDGNTSMVAELVKLAGHHGSALEARVWEEIFAAPSVSAVKIIQEAAAQGIPVYKLEAGSSTRQLSQEYAVGTLEEIQDALLAGYTVTVPERPVNFPAGYMQQEGYILANPLTGAAAYKINAALNGGASSGNGGEGSGGGECPACSASSQPTNSTVNMANGNLREEWVDLALPAPGLPIVWGRTYASRAKGMTEVGYGWMHTYGTHLRPELNGDVTWVQEDWREARFTKAGTAYTAPAGYFHTLTSLPDGWRLKDKHGLIQEFNAQGRLRLVQDTSGNRVEVLYQQGLIAQVKDSNGQEALSFSYVGNKLASVTDRAGRMVRYTYEGDNLTSATDVLGAKEDYGYDAVHNLTRRTDKLGNTHLLFYDVRDRYVGGRSPLGEEWSVFYDEVARTSTYVDKTGAAWTRTHNAAGNPTAYTSPLGLRTEVAWDASHNKLSEKDARGFTTTHTYDAKGNLLTRTFPDGSTETLTYNTPFNQVLTHARTGQPTTNNTYDAAGRLLTSRDGLGTTTYTYDARGQLKTVTAPGNATTMLAYNPDGTLASMTDATGVVTRMEYSTAGHLQRTVDGLGNARTLEVDAAGRMLAMVDAEGHRTSFTYDASGNRLTSTDAAGHTTKYTYDAAGRLKATTDALGHTTSTEYDAEGRVVAQVDARGVRTTRRYDAAGRLVETTSPTGERTSMAFCADVAEVCATVDAEGNLTTKQFDAAGRVVSATDALGRTSTWRYDAAGRVTFTAGPGQVDTTYAYDGNGLLWQVAAGPLTTTYSYDVRGNRTQVNASGLTKYTYDAANRLLTETNPLNQVTGYTYDAAGRRGTKTDGNGKLTRHTYDASGRLTAVLFADGTQYTYGYDALGRRTLEKSDSHERHMAYDALGRLKEVEDVTLNKRIAYGYDALGNRTRMEVDGAAYGYAYDAEGRLSHVTDAQGHHTTFGYDVLGRRASVARPNGVRTTYSYDAAGQVLNILHSRNGLALAGFAYEYDATGNRTSKTLVDGTREAYGYDSGDRLVSVHYGTARSVSYTLSTTGNRTAMTETTYPSGTAVNRTTNYGYNSFNQLQWLNAPGASTNYTYDANGNLLNEATGTQVKRYSWDADNRLRQLTMPNGQVRSYNYDANGLRVEQATPAAMTKYLLDGPSVVQEMDAGGATLARYLTHPQGVDEILSFEKDGGTYYPLTDALGSVYAVADGAGQVVRSYSYDVYGERAASGSGPELAFGFTGREHDASGLRYHRDRYADGVVGRWNQPDRLGFVDGPNVYQYVGSSPVGFVDPTGRNTLVMYGNPNDEDGLVVKTRSGRVMTGWRLSDENVVSYGDSVRRFVQRHVRESLDDIDAFPFWTQAHVEYVGSLERSYRNVVYFGHAAHPMPALLLDMLSVNGHMFAEQFSEVIVRLGVSSMSNVFLVGCDTESSGFASKLRMKLSWQVAVAGAEGSVYMDVRVEDAPPHHVYDLKTR